MKKILAVVGAVVAFATVGNEWKTAIDLIVNDADTDAVKAAFEDLYQRMHGMTLREMDRIVDVVCVLCTEHEKAGFTEGVKVGVLLGLEI